MITARNAAVNKTVLAEFLDCATPYIDQLVREEGFPQFIKGGTFPLRDVVVWYIRRLKNRRLSSEQEATLKIQVERQIKELQLAKMRGEVVEMAAVYSALEKPFGAARGRLLALSRQIAPQVIGMKSTLEAEAIIDQYIRDILNEWATGIQRNGVDPSVVPNPQTAAKIDGFTMGGHRKIPKRRGQRGGRKVAHGAR